MKIKSAVYTGSFVDWQKMFANNLAEVAFAGRSNVGKSSLINYLCNQKKLAHTSAQPGKTQTFNFYSINNEWNLVDLPGYGYAKVSQKMRVEWLERMMNYFENRMQLTCVCQLVDARIAPQKIDLEFMQALLQLKVEAIIIFTKADKKWGNDPAKNIAAYKRELKKTNENFPTHFITSASDKTGKEELLQWIEKRIAK